MRKTSNEFCLAWSLPFLLLTHQNSRAWYLIMWFLVGESVNPIRWKYTHPSPVWFCAASCP